MAGVAIRWVGFVFLLTAALVWLDSGEVQPHIVALSAGLMVIGALWPYRHPRDLPPGLTVEVTTRPPTQPPRRTPPLRPDRLTAIEAEWLADPRPAWETVADFERDVERAMVGHKS